jgi:DNA replication protein DnaC
MENRKPTIYTSNVSLSGIPSCFSDTGKNIRAEAFMRRLGETCTFVEFKRESKK